MSATPRIRAVDRAPGAFQQPVPDEVLVALVAEAVPDAAATLISELDVGTVSNLYRIEFIGRDPPILKLAPPAGALPRGQDAGLRAEVAVVPWLRPLGDLVARIVAHDFSHRLVNRDWVMQTLLPGVPAVRRLANATDAEQQDYFADLGRLTRAVHAIEGDHFGPVLGARFERWSTALAERFAELVAGYERAGLDPAVLRRAMRSIPRDRDVLDAASPRLTHGDLWTLNVLLDDTQGSVRISGVLDWETAAFADPLSDWPIHQAGVVDNPATDAFWQAYGPVPDDADTARRRRFYTALRRAGARLDIRRRGLDEAQIPARFWDLADLDL